MNVNDVLTLGAEIASDVSSSAPLDPFITSSLNQINDSLIVLIVFIGAILGAFIIRSLRR